MKPNLRSAFDTIRALIAVPALLLLFGSGIAEGNEAPKFRTSCPVLAGSPLATLHDFNDLGAPQA